jgi:hypothetical protein
MLNLFPSPVKFPSLTDLEKLAVHYTQISMVALQENVVQCGVPPEEATPELLHRRKTTDGQEGSSKSQEEEDNTHNA